jgi:DNA-binding IscR family transcriptional regulator
MRISKEKRDKIAEQILSHLYHSFPTQLFTAKIAKELARDEEFIKRLLFELQEKGLVSSIKKNTKGISFLKRIKWQLSSKAYEAYHQKATNLE